MWLKGRYDFLNQDGIIFGKPLEEGISEVLESLEVRKVLIIASRTLSKKTNVVERARKALGSSFAGLFDDCAAHAPIHSILHAAEYVRQKEPDLLLTIGGGSPIDTAKVLQICLAEEITNREQLIKFRIKVKEDGTRVLPKIAKSPIRQVAIPTTLSGAEFSNIGGCTDDKRAIKDLYTSPDIGARYVIYDPTITIHTPHWLWYSTGVRAVDHAVETICSTNHQPYTDATCSYGLKMLASSLKRTKDNPEDHAARLESQLGVWLASTGLGRVDWGASHGIGHQLGAVAGVAHGHTSCVLLPNVLRFNYQINSDRQKFISEILGQPNVAAADLIEQLIEQLEMPTRLRDVGVKEKHFNDIASGAMHNMMVRTNPRSINHPNDVIEILNMAY